MPQMTNVRTLLVQSAQRGAVLVFIAISRLQPRRSIDALRSASSSLQAGVDVIAVNIFPFLALIQMSFLSSS